MDIRWIQRFSNYRKALVQLKNAAQLAKKRELSQLEEQGLLQTFEFTHELAWKTLKDFLQDRGVTESMYGSRDVVREAFANDLIDEGESWMDMILSRNLTSHIYDEETVHTITEDILSKYISEFIKLEQKLSTLSTC